MTSSDKLQEILTNANIECTVNSISTILFNKENHLKAAKELLEKISSVKSVIVADHNELGITEIVGSRFSLGLEF